MFVCFNLGFGRLILWLTPHIPGVSALPLVHMSHRCWLLLGALSHPIQQLLSVQSADSKELVSWCHNSIVWIVNCHTQVWAHTSSNADNSHRT